MSRTERGVRSACAKLTARGMILYDHNAMLDPVVEVYKTYDPLEAGRIQDLLADHAIACSIRDLAISPYPLTIGRFGEKRVAVSPPDAPEARRLLLQAIQDGYVSPDGSWIPVQ